MQKKNKHIYPEIQCIALLLGGLNLHPLQMLLPPEIFTHPAGNKTMNPHGAAGDFKNWCGTSDFVLAELICL